MFLLTMRRLPSGRLRRNASKFFTCAVNGQLRQLVDVAIGSTVRGDK